VSTRRRSAPASFPLRAAAASVCASDGSATGAITPGLCEAAGQARAVRPTASSATGLMPGHLTPMLAVGAASLAVSTAGPMAGLAVGAASTKVLSSFAFTAAADSASAVELDVEVGASPAGSSERPITPVTPVTPVTPAAALPSSGRPASAASAQSSRLTVRPSVWQTVSAPIVRADCPRPPRCGSLAPSPSMSKLSA